MARKVFRCRQIGLFAVELPPLPAQRFDLGAEAEVDVFDVDAGLLQLAGQIAPSVEHQRGQAAMLLHPFQHRECCRQDRPSQRL